jgi:hypothetical protein
LKKIQTVRPVSQKQTHGAMWFKCQECGKRWRMWLEKGVEDRRFRRIYPEQHKTVPESIICQCGGSAEHVDWENDFWISKCTVIGVIRRNHRRSDRRYQETGEVIGTIMLNRCR